MRLEQGTLEGRNRSKSKYVKRAQNDQERVVEILFADSKILYTHTYYIFVQK